MKEILEKTRQNVKEANKEILSQSISLISSAFILVAALAWNEAIKDLISQYFHSGSGLVSRFVYAIVVTIIAAIVASRLNRILQKYKESGSQKPPLSS
ncbi:MAG: DUF5654 family protein [Patescibacteria group bacterium]|nr:DUF5654 family protein [Patescibacteria group bacterium]